MPFGVQLFLAYGFLILAGIGISLRWVIEQANEMAVSPIGVVWMGLLAYSIFTITLVLQRKEAARGLALGLASLTIPAVPYFILAGFPVPAIAAGLLAFGLFRGLTRPSVRAYLAEP